MDFSLVGKSISVLAWEDGKEKSFNLKSLEDRLGFIDKLRPGDEIYLVSGGLSENLASLACKKGVKVGIIAGAKVKAERKKGESVTEVLKRLVEERPNEFNIWLPEEAEVLDITLLFNDWQKVMEERKATANRIRQSFYAQVLRTPEKYKHLDIDELKEIGKREIEEDAHYQWLCQREREAEKMLMEAVKNSALYQKVFKDLDGCGPLIAARLIVYIRTIDRFRKWEALAKYCGFGLTKEGKKQRRRKKESLGYHPQLKSTILQLWLRGQLLRWQKGKSYLSQLLIQRIEKEMADKKAGIKKVGTPTGRALWWMGRKLCRMIFYKWRAYKSAH